MQRTKIPTQPDRSESADATNVAGNLGGPPGTSQPGQGAGVDAATTATHRGDDATAADAVSDDSTWAPLAVPVFRAFWIASLVSNLGTWVHEVGAGWLMTRLDPTPEMVSAVRVAMSLPMLVLAIPAGVLADRFDRRQLLIVTQLLLLATTATLAWLTLTDAITAWGLLGLTFVIGLGMVLHVLTWQSTIPMLVPRRQLSRAIALGSISFNLARAAGPAIGGVLIAMAGVWITFAVNAFSFAGVMAVLLWWKPARAEPAPTQTFRRSLTDGLRFAVGHKTMRHVLIGVLLFLTPATALWSLLPLVARQQLGWQAQGFGLLVTSLGLGAVVAARFLHAMHRRLRLDWTVAVSMILFAVGLLVMASTRQGVVVLLATFVMGATWMLTLTTLNASAQLTLPDHLRARGMGAYMTVMAASMAIGSLIWGQVAGHIGLVPTQIAAAVTLLVTAATSLQFPIDEAYESHASDER